MQVVKTKGNLAKDTPKLATPMTDDNEELQIISMARTLSAERIRNGTATAQEILYWLKQGSSEVRLDKECKEEQKKLLVAKTKAIASAESSEKLYADAVKAMRKYKGEDDEEENSDIF